MTKVYNEEYLFTNVCDNYALIPDFIRVIFTNFEKALQNIRRWFVGLECKRSATLGSTEQWYRGHIQLEEFLKMDDIRYRLGICHKWHFCKKKIPSEMEVAPRYNC